MHAGDREAGERKGWRWEPAVECVASHFPILHINAISLSLACYKLLQKSCYEARERHDVEQNRIPRLTVTGDTHWHWGRWEPKQVL